MIGTQIGWLVVLEKVRVPYPKSRRGPFYRCECRRCGNNAYIAASGDLNTGRIRSCGCYRNSLDFAEAHVVHGHSRRNTIGRSRTYNIWCGIKKRCNNPNTENAYWYKDITLSPEWHSFEAFLSDMGECPEGLEIDRIDNTRGYEKGNCRWTTHKENCQNRRNSRHQRGKGDGSELS